MCEWVTDAREDRKIRSRSQSLNPMQIYRWLVIVCAVLVGACQSQHPLAQRSTQWMGDFSPVGSYNVERRHSFILPYDASIYIANPVNAIVKDDGVDVNSLIVSPTSLNVYESVRSPSSKVTLSIRLSSPPSSPVTVGSDATFASSSASSHSCRSSEM